MDQKISQLNNLPAADAADLYAIVDTSAGETKNISQEQVEDTIANSENFVDQLVENTDFTTHLANDPNFVTQLTQNTDFQTNVSNFIQGGGSSGGGGSLFYSTGAQVVVGTSDTQTVATIPITARMLGTKNAIRVRIPFSLLVQNNSASQIVVTATYGGTTYSAMTTAGAAISSGDAVTGYFELFLFAANSESLQKFQIGEFAGAPDQAMAFGIIASAYDTSSEDSTLDHDLVVSIVTDSGSNITTEGVFAEILSGIGFQQPMSFTLPGTNSSTNSLFSYYSDREAFIYYDSSGLILSVNASPNINFTRDLSSDWASMASINSAILIGNDLYVLLRDSSNNYRVYKYDATNSATAGTLCTISGTALGNMGGNTVTMTYNGTSIFFSFQGGNSSSDNIISKYSLSGSTLTFVSNTTMASGSGFFDHTFFVSRIGNYYGTTVSDGVIKEYNSSGTLVLTTPTRAFPGGESANIGNSFYGCVNSSVFVYCKIYLTI